MITHKPLTVILRNKLPYGIRNEDGFICFMWKPHRYPDQKARYIEETQQVIDQAALFAAAPDLLAALKASRIDLLLLQINVRDSLKVDPNWEGMPEILDIYIAKCDDAIAKAEKI